MAESNKPERRVFLRVLGAAAATWAASACSSESQGGTTTGHAATGGGGGGAGGATGSGGMGGSGGACTGTGISVGELSLYAADGIHMVSEGSVLIGRDAGGVYALSSFCTHRGCNLNGDGQVVFNGIRCLCHGSVFSVTGTVIEGPAFSPLPAYAVSSSCGQLFVDTSQMVPNTQRLAV